MRTVERWKRFWSQQTTPLHQSDSADFYRVCAEELKVLFGNHAPKRVLEIGCGNGALFDFLNFDPANYRGVDFSPTLLAAFQSRYPQVALERAEGASYADHENQYDLIFSHGVIQYFDMPMLDTHFASARRMMHKNSLFVCASIPWRLHRSNYERGRLTRQLRPSLLRMLKSKIARGLFGDSMGHWYNLDEISDLAAKHGFSVEFYGSMVYMYRFHAVMRCK